MGNEQPRTKSEIINTHLQNIAIIVAAAWIFGSFLYEKVYLPETSPATVNVEINLRSLGISSGSNFAYTVTPFYAVEMSVFATNQNTREIDLPASAWISTGLKILPPDEGRAPVDFKTSADKILQYDTDQFNYFDYQEHFYRTTSPEVIATGKLFNDTTLKPNEKIERTIIFYVPVSAGLDVVDVKAIVFSAKKGSQFNMSWELQLPGVGKRPDLLPYIKKGGQSIPLEQDGSRKYLDNIQLWKSEARRNLLLVKS